MDGKREKDGIQVKKEQKGTMYSRVAKVAFRARARRNTTILSVCLAVLVASVVLVRLILPAVALNDSALLDCPYEVHQHSDSCYTEVPVYDNDGEEIGTDKVLTCGQADYVLHEHDENCYQNGRLVCNLPEIKEHIHTEDCYEDQTVLVCDKVEGNLDENGEAHIHDDSCYEKQAVLTCGQQELHEHTKKCYDKDGNLICGLLELSAHEHDSKCIKEVIAEEASEEVDADVAEADLEEKSVDETTEMTEGIDDVADDSITPNVSTDQEEVREDEAIENSQEQGAAENISVEETTEVTADTEEASDEKDNKTNQDQVDKASDDKKEEALSDGTIDEKAAADDDSEKEFDTDEDKSESAMPAQTFEGQVKGSDSTITVHVEAPEGAFTDGTNMTVSEVYDEATISTIEKTVKEDQNIDGTVQKVQAVDITFFDKDGKEVEPVAPITVTMSSSLVREARKDDDTGLAAIHVDDKGQGTVVRMDEGQIDKNDNEADTLVFEAESFSVYALVTYTVDFEYDGLMVSIPGESSVLLSTLIAELGADQDGNDSQAANVSEINIADIKNVTFSNNNLVKVTRIKKDASVNDLLTQLDEQGVETWMADGLVIRSDHKTDEEIIKEAEAIDQMDNEAVVSGGDWLLTTLQAFHSEEALTIEMKDGSIYVIKVTDLDTATNGVKPSTINGYDSASAGITITMFDYGPDKLDNVNNTYKSTDNSGINSGHKLKFYSYGTEGSTMNNFTGGAYAMQGIVKTELENGYPVTNNGENLAYLFNETSSGNNKKVYQNVNGLFLYDDSTGLMHYSSDENYAYMNPNQNSSGGYDFVLYNDTYTEEGADYENPFRIGFFPYNDYDNRYRCIHGDNFRWGCKGQNDRRVRDQVGHYNHHFGMKVEGSFYMTDDKKTPIGDQDMIFEFSGDDDMWVFIDGVLVLDIGGIHNPVDGKINFTTGEVTVSAAKTASGGGNYALGTNTTIADAFAKAGKNWDDSPLSQHDIKIFYMERGGMYSNLEISMNLPTFPEPKQVELWKVNQENADEKLAGAQFELYSDYACTKPIKASGSNSPVIITSVTNPKGRVLVDNLVPGQTYYLKETKAPEGYKLDNRVFKIVAPANDDSNEAKIYLATSEEEFQELPNSNITNAEDKYGSFDFFKVKEGDTGTKLSGAQFTLYTDLDCTNIAKNKTGQALQYTSLADGKIRFEDIPAGKTYYMKETSEPEGYIPSSDVYTVEVDQSGKVTVSLGSEVKFTSQSENNARLITNKSKEPEKTNISVDKRWSDGAANHTNDTVTVQLYQLVTNTINVSVNWGGKDPGDDAKVTVTFSANGYEDVVVTLDKDTLDWAKAVDLVDGVTYSVTFKKEGEKVSSVTGNDTFTASPNGTYQLTGSLVASQINVPVSVTWTGGTPATGETVTVVIKDNDNVESDHTVTLPYNNSWSSSVELTEGKSYSITYNYSNDSSITNVTGTSSLTVASDGTSSISATGTIGTYDGKLHVIFENPELLPNNWNCYLNFFNMRVDDAAQDGNSPFYNYIVNYNGDQKMGSKNFANDSSDYDFNIPFSEDQVKGFGIQFGYWTNDDTVITPYAEGMVDDGNGLYHFPKTSNVIKLQVKQANRGFGVNKSTLRNAQKLKIQSSNFLNGTHQLPAGATPVAGEAPVVLNENHDGSWAKTWTVPVSDVEGAAISYYVVETAVDLADGDNSDVVSSSYEYIYNVDGDESSGIKTVIITNTVQPKTSLEVTKEWLNADGSQTDDHDEITFEVHQVVGGRDTVYSEDHTIAYDTEKGAYKTVTVANLPAKVKDGDTLKDASYYVVETSPKGNDNLTTYYEAGGKQYADPADAAGAESETIVNKNVSREITVTKQWLYKKGSQTTTANEPPQKDVYFKLKKIQDDGQDAGYFTVTDSVGLPTSDIEPNGYSAYSNSAGGNGTIYHLICTSTTTEHQSELDPEHTYSTTSWAWNTLTFNNLPTGCKYVLVETDSEGRELLSDAIGTQITYVDENGKLMSETSPIDPAIPGNYTIKNTEHRTSLYAQKVWQGANKDNLAGNESVWFSLMRVETDGNGQYDLTTLEETPEIGRFALKESSGWVKYFDSIEVAPPERHASDTFKYYQYFIVELGLLDQDTANLSDTEKTYSLINNLYIKYQSKGSGTAADGSAAVGRVEYKPYSQSVDLSADNDVTGSKTVNDWINALKADQTLVSGLLTNDMVRLNTWGDKYDGMGTLGAFNSSQEFLTKPLEISKEWKDADGNDLPKAELDQINASGEGDHYQVEIQLMQHAYNLQGKDSTLTYDVPYGSTFMIDPENVVMQSDLFEVSRNGTGKWDFKINAANSEGENQLPLKGPFRIPDSTETVQAEFEYYVSEYRVYNNDGNDVTTLWSAACVKNNNGDSPSLQLQNRKTTDLVLHKSWENVPAENRSWIDDNVQAVLFKVWRKASDEADATDITEYIGARPSAYGLSRANVYDVELDGVYEDFVRVDKPDGGWAITDLDSADAVLTISNLDALVKDYLTEQATDGNLSNWPKYQYWIEEWGYVDSDGKFQFVETLLHGNTQTSADHPKYQKSTGSTTVSLEQDGTSGYGSSAPAAAKPAASTIGKSAEIDLGSAGQNHLGAVNTVRGLELTIIKTDNAATPKKLTNAQFILKQKSVDGSWLPFTYLADTDADDRTADVTVTSADGKFTITAENGYIIKNLMPGQYKLEEVKSPDGYIIQFRPLEFEVTMTGRIVAPGTDTVLTGGADKHFTYTMGTSPDKASGTITVQNEPGAALPNTGGPGTGILMSLGSILVLFGTAGWILFRRREAF